MCCTYTQLTQIRSIIQVTWCKLEAQSRRGSGLKSQANFPITLSFSLLLSSVCSPVRIVDSRIYLWVLSIELCLRTEIPVPLEPSHCWPTLKGQKSKKASGKKPAPMGKKVNDDRGETLPAVVCVWSLQWSSRIPNWLRTGHCDHSRRDWALSRWRRLE